MIFNNVTLNGDITHSGITLAGDISHTVVSLEPIDTINYTAAKWGYIQGTLSDQTDLITLLNLKADAGSLSPVATSGSYLDLTNTPTIPSKVSDLTNDSGFLTENDVAPVATSGDYEDLSNLPAIPTKTSDLTNDSGFATETQVQTVANAVEELAGDVPTKTSDLVNDSGFITTIPSQYVTETELSAALLPKANTADLAAVATSGSYNDLTNKPTIPEDKVLIVTFTGNASDGYVASHSVDEIKQAHSDGKAVIAVLGQNAYLLERFTTRAVMFSAVVTLYTSITGFNIKNYYVQINSDGTVVVENIGIIPTDRIVTTIDSSGKDTHVPSAKAVYNYVSSAVPSDIVNTINGQTGTVTISTATTSADGLMSAQDKTKLETVYADYSSALTALGV